jgi:hypothetical protein
MRTRSIRRVAAGLTLMVGGFTAQSTIAAASGGTSTTSDGVAVLQELCVARKGLFAVTPYQIARCQAARGAGMGFELERAVCGDDLGATFTDVASFEKPNRRTWACA